MDKNTHKIDLSIIVPAFNEEGGIRQTIKEIFKDVNKTSIKKVIKSYEVIVIDDGSRDDTPQILKELKERFKNLKVVKHKTNQGLGASIITGVKFAKKDFITYLPADGQVFLREITDGLKLAPFCDLVLTYRGKRKDYNPYRHLLSNSLMIFMKILFGLNYKDYNWVHIYKKELFNRVKTQSKGVFYLGEVVARTNNGGFKILEAEAKYHPRSTGYSKNARLPVVLRTLKDLLRLWMELRVKPII